MRSYLSFDHDGCSVVVGNACSGACGISVGLSGLFLMGELAGRVSWRVMRARFVLQELHRHSLEQGVEHYLRSQSAWKYSLKCSLLWCFFVRLNFKNMSFWKKQSVSLEKQKGGGLTHSTEKAIHFILTAWTEVDMNSLLTCTISQLGSTVVNEEGSKDTT